MPQPQPNDLPDNPEDLPPDLKKLAETWHQRLKEPGVKQLIQDGKMKVSPLVQKLLEMYPAKESPPT